MTPDEFEAWLADMKSAGLARSDADCARLLGVSANALVTMKSRDTNLRTALACAALLRGVPPYPKSPRPRGPG